MNKTVAANFISLYIISCNIIQKFEIMYNNHKKHISVVTTYTKKTMIHG